MLDLPAIAPSLGGVEPSRLSVVDERHGDSTRIASAKVAYFGQDQLRLIFTVENRGKLADVRLEHVLIRPSKKT